MSPSSEAGAELPKLTTGRLIEHPCRHRDAPRTQIARPIRGPGTARQRPIALALGSSASGSSIRRSLVA